MEPGAELVRTQSLPVEQALEAIGRLTRTVSQTLAEPHVDQEAELVWRRTSPRQLACCPLSCDDVRGRPAGRQVQLVRTASPRRAAAARLVEMGFPMHAAMEALRRSDDDAPRAVEALLSGDIDLAEPPPAPAPAPAARAAAAAAQLAARAEEPAREPEPEPPTVCVICMDDLEPDDLERSRGNSCPHGFHLDCFG